MLKSGVESDMIAVGVEKRGVNVCGRVPMQLSLSRYQARESRGALWWAIDEGLSIRLGGEKVVQKVLLSQSQHNGSSRAIKEESTIQLSGCEFV